MERRQAIIRRQFHATIYIIDNQGDNDVEDDDDGCKHVEAYASLLERGEERGSHLQTDAEHKQNQAEIADEMQDGRIAREAEMTHEDAHEQHKGDAQ